MHTIITNGRFSNLNATTRGHAREELHQRVWRNHRFTVKSSALPWFTPRYYLWLMHHTTQGELNLMGFGPRPLSFAGFVEDPHFQELYARAGSMIESEHRRIVRRIHGRRSVHVDLTQLFSWSDEQFVMRPLARRSNNMADGVSRSRMMRSWMRREVHTSHPQTEKSNSYDVNGPCCAVCRESTENSNLQTRCCGQPALCEDCLKMYKDLSADSNYPVVDRCPLCNWDWSSSGPSMVPRRDNN